MINQDDLKHKLASLSIFKGSVNLSYFKGIMTNDVYLARDDGNQYIVKVRNNQSYGVIRAHEIAASKAAHDAGIAPALLYHDDTILVFQYIASLPLSQQIIREKVMLQRLMPLLKIAHHNVIKYLDKPHISASIFAEIMGGIFFLKKHNSPYCNKFNNYIKDCHYFNNLFISYKLVFTHSDLSYTNCLDDGDKLWLIDWEYSGFNPVLFDLADLSQKNAFTHDEDVFLLEQYYADSVNSVLYYHFHAAKCIQILCMIIWHMISEVRSHKNLDCFNVINTALDRYQQQCDYFFNLKVSVRF